VPRIVRETASRERWAPCEDWLAGSLVRPVRTMADFPRRV